MPWNCWFSVYHAPFRPRIDSERRAAADTWPSDAAASHAGKRDRTERAWNSPDAKSIDTVLAGA